MERRERKNIKIFKEITAENFPNLIKIVMYTSKKFNEFQQDKHKRSTPRQIIIKILTTDKDKEKNHINGTLIRLTADFSSKRMEKKRHLNYIF